MPLTGWVAAEVGGQADDAVAGLLREAQEDRVRQARAALLVQQVRVPNQIHHPGVVAVEDVPHHSPTDDQHVASFHRWVISPKCPETH